MCTVSWCQQSEGYTLFFNRDESKGRSEGLPPQPHVGDSVAYVCPRDPDGGGTWLLANSHGLTLGLLNYYETQGRYRPTAPLSRGRLPLDCRTFRILDEVENFFTSVDLSPFPPFLFLGIDPACRTVLIRWTGKRPRISQPGFSQLPLTTSAFQPDAVVAERRANFRRQIPSLECAPERLVQFHQSHDPDRSAFSPLMTRPDARTVSLSQISVSRKETRFTYRDRRGDFPQLSDPVSVSIPRKAP
ncbi:MAG: hypothetical protein F7O42_06740 [Opitutae bacterium]|nr:hypothetical protein [Opitutae bacterium]